MLSTATRGPPGPVRRLQALRRSGAFAPMAAEPVRAALDDLQFGNPTRLYDAIDASIRAYVTPPTLVAESGVRFPDLPDTPVEVAGNFITSGTQMQMVLVGTEPVLVVQPEYDAEAKRVTLTSRAFRNDQLALFYEATIGTTRLYEAQRLRLGPDTEHLATGRADGREVHAHAAALLALTGALAQMGPLRDRGHVVVQQQQHRGKQQGQQGDGA